MFLAGIINTRLFFRHTVGLRGSKKQADAEVVPISSLVEVEVVVEVEFEVEVGVEVMVEVQARCSLDGVVTTPTRTQHNTTSTL